MATKGQTRKLFLPNSSPVPNFIFDLILADREIPHALRSVLFLLVRKTIGWDRRSDEVSLTQIQNGASVSRATADHAVTVICDGWGLFRKESSKRFRGINRFVLAGLDKDHFERRYLALEEIYETGCPTRQALREKPLTPAMIAAALARLGSG